MVIFGGQWLDNGQFRLSVRRRHCTKVSGTISVSRQGPAVPMVCDHVGSISGELRLNVDADTKVVYHLHGQTGRFTVWVYGKENSGLVNVVL